MTRSQLRKAWKSRCRAMKVSPPVTGAFGDPACGRGSRQRPPPRPAAGTRRKQASRRRAGFAHRLDHSGICGISSRSAALAHLRDQGRRIGRVGSPSSAATAPGRKAWPGARRWGVSRVEAHRHRRQRVAGALGVFSLHARQAGQDLRVQRLAPRLATSARAETPCRCLAAREVGAHVAQRVLRVAGLVLAGRRQLDLLQLLGHRADDAAERATRCPAPAARTSLSSPWCRRPAASPARP